MYKVLLNGTQIPEPFGLGSLILRKSRSTVFGGFLGSEFGYVESIGGLSFADAISKQIFKAELESLGAKKEISFELYYCEKLIFSGGVDISSIVVDDCCNYTAQVNRGDAASVFEAKKSTNYALAPTERITLPKKNYLSEGAYSLGEITEYRSQTLTGMTVNIGVPLKPDGQVAGQVESSTTQSSSSPPRANDGINGRDGRDGRDGIDGTNGTDGHTPYIGINGNWWINGTDTGVSATTDGIWSENIDGSIYFDTNPVLVGKDTDSGKAEFQVGGKIQQDEAKGAMVFADADGVLIEADPDTDYLDWNHDAAGIVTLDITNWNAAYAAMHSHSNKAVLDGITSGMVANWQSAYGAMHSHANKAILDATEQSFTTALKNKLDGIAVNANNYSLPIASASVLGGVKVGTNLSIDGGGILSAVDTTYSGSASIALVSGSFERAALTGDVTASQNSNATTIANNVVTNAKLAQVSSGIIKGRQTAGTGNVEDLSASQVRSIINVADGANNYVHPTGDGNLHVPANGTTNAGKFLKAAATAGVILWASIAKADISDFAHTHAIADVTGLQTALDGKEAAFTKGSVVAGTGVSLSGTLTDRLVGSGNLTIALNTTYSDGRYLRKDAADNNGANKLTLGSLESGNALFTGSINATAINAGTTETDILVLGSGGLIKYRPLSGFGGIGVENSAGTNQFSAALGQGIRFAGSGDTTVAFNAATRTITITSIPGSGSGGVVTSIFGRTGGVTAEAGDYNTSQVTEHSSALYFTQARVLATPLTGYAVGSNTAIAATDTILQAFGKVQGQLNAKQPLDGDLTAIAALSGTSGFLKKTAADTWSLDTNTYLTSYSETDTLQTVTNRGNATTTPITAKVFRTQITNDDYNLITRTGNTSTVLYVQSGDANGDLLHLMNGSTSPNVGTSRFFVRGNGRVGIGTSTPTEQLHVVGGIRQTVVINSLLKTNTDGVLIAAVAGIDYLTTNQNITLSGDVVGTGTTAISTTIATGAVTFAKMQTIAQGSILGRYSSGTGAVQTMTFGTGITYNATTGVISATGTGGTVTTLSVGGLSPLFTASVATATSTPSVTFAAVNQNANLVYAGPASGTAAAPTFRALVALDIPNLDAAKITTGVIAPARLGSGTASSAYYLSGDGNWTLFPTSMTPSAHTHLWANITDKPNGGNYIFNQFDSAQASSNFWIAGNGAVGGNFFVGRSASTNISLVLGRGITADSNMNIQFATSVTNASSWDAIIQRLSGENGSFVFSQKGAGNFVLDHQGTGAIILNHIGTGSVAIQRSGTNHFQMFGSNNFRIGGGADNGAKLQVAGAIQQTSVVSSLLKANASGVIVPAVAGTDYLVSANIGNGTLTLATGSGLSGSATFAANQSGNATFTVSLDADLAAIAALSGTGLLKRTGADTWAFDTNTYLTANQSITLSGDVTGSGTTSIATGINNGVVTNAKLANVATATIKGRVSSGTGAVEDLTASQVRSLLSVYTTSEVDSALSGKANTTHTHSAATTSVNGFMSAADKTKLDGLSNYTHPTSGVTAGTYNNVTVNAQGHVTAGSNVAYLTALPAHTHTTADISNLSSYTGFDARYYTETEVDTLLGGKSNTGHTHAWADITGKPSSFTPSAHTLDSHSNVTITSNSAGEILKWSGTAWINNTLAEAGISAVGHTHAWSEITGKPSTFAPSSHTHTTSEISNLSSYTGLDARYYTETEIDSLLAGKSNTSHTHSNATTSVAGFMSAADKVIINGIATNYVNTTGAQTAILGTKSWNGAQTYNASITAKASAWIEGKIYVKPTGAGTDAAIELGDGRSSAGSSSIYFYPTAGSYVGFSITRASGTNGNALIQNIGSGSLGIEVSGTGIINFKAGSQAGQILNNGSWYVGTSASPATSSYKFRIDSGSDSGDGLHVRGKIYTTNNQIYYSDRKLKSNIEAIKNPLALIRQTDGYSYIMYDENKYGVIAQEIQKIMPFAVTDVDGILGVDYNAVTALNVAAIKQVDSEVEKLKERVKQLETEVQCLRSRQ